MVDYNLVYFIVFLILWLYFIDLYFNEKSMMVGLVQFGFMVPLEIILSSLAFTYTFGWLIVFLIPIFSLYLLIDSIYYRKNKNKKKNV